MSQPSLPLLPFLLDRQAFLKGSKYDAWLDVSADADPKRLLQKAQLVASSGESSRAVLGLGWPRLERER